MEREEDDLGNQTLREIARRRTEPISDVTPRDRISIKEQRHFIIETIEQQHMAACLEQPKSN